MAFVPPDFSLGAGDPKRGALQLFTLAGNIRRLCNEIMSESDLNAFKIYDLAGHCFLFKQEADKWRNGGGDINAVRDALIQLTHEAGIGNPLKTSTEINDDYRALYAAAGDFLAWATANLPAQDNTLPGSPVVFVTRTWPGPILTVRTTKTVGVTNQVTALRAVFI